MPLPYQANRCSAGPATGLRGLADGWVRVQVVADADQELQALIAEVTYLTEVIEKRQTEVVAASERRKAAIRELRDRGVRPAEIARLAGISRQAVQHLLGP